MCRVCTKPHRPQPAGTHEPLGDAAVAVSLGGARPPRVDAKDLPPGVTDLVVAFGRAVAYFDPAIVEVAAGASPSEAVGKWLAAAPGASGSPARGARGAIEVPVFYGGAEGADLEEVARRAGLTAEEVVARHARPYRVAAVGFQPGFPYLEGLPEELQVPRRDTPRPRVPAGSVAIGGPYTGVYPNESPGGWRLIGRTATRLYDPRREPAALVQPGDTVRFRAIDRAEFDRLTVEPRPARRAAAADGEAVLRVVSAGAWTALHAPAPRGRRSAGAPAGGPMDAEAHRLACALAGGPVGGAAIEATLVGPVLEALRDVRLGLAGATPARLRGSRRIDLAAGQRLDLRALAGGARAYVAAAGGLVGLEGERLSDGDPIHSAPTEPADLQPTPEWWGPSATRRATLRLLAGPQSELLGPSGLDRLCRSAWRVGSQSNRMGLRLDGPPVSLAGAPPDESQPTCHGAVQLPGDGRPIVLGADAQTLGGYPIVAVVASVDWPALAQLRPGDPVRFEPITLAEAEHFRRLAERELALAIQGFRLRLK
ncbi:5-oxoprolinase subunit PxpB [Botrimarina sp.]|uniref:5-oxoprolinase subunit PxpB n=1 Tax=Botrimarina sp. TaxID=2795802 RepID=UPI0032EB225B